MKMEFTGIDASKDISLNEYGLLVTTSQSPDAKPNEYLCVYRISPNRFDTGYTTESELDQLINGESWANKQDIQSFLSFVDCSSAEWIALPFVHKLSDVLSFWGYENIFGTSCTEGMSATDAEKLTNQ